MKSLTIYVLSFCAVLGLISFELRKNDISLEALGVLEPTLVDAECNCYQFVRNGLSLETEKGLNNIHDLREALEINGYSMEKSPKKGDVVIFSKGFDESKFKKGYAGIVYEVWDNNGVEQIQLRSADSQSDKVFTQSHCINVGISEFLPIANRQKKKISYWRKG